METLQHLSVKTAIHAQQHLLLSGMIVPEEYWLCSDGFDGHRVNVQVELQGQEYKSVGTLQQEKSADRMTKRVTRLQAAVAEQKD